MGAEIDRFEIVASKGDNWSAVLDKIGAEFLERFKRYGYESAESFADAFSGRLNELSKEMTCCVIEAPVIETSVNTGDAMSSLEADLSSLTNMDVSNVLTPLESIRNAITGISGLGSSFTDLSSEIDGIFGEEGAIATVSTIGSKIGEIVSSFKDLSSGFDGGFGEEGAIAAISTIGSKIGEIGSSFTDLAADLDGIFGEGGAISTISTIGSKLGELFGSSGIFSAIGAGPLIAIVVGIVAVVAAIIDLWNTSETFRDAVGTAFERVKTSLGNVFSKISEAVVPLVEKIKELGRAFYEFYEDSGLKRIIEIIASLAVTLAGFAVSALITEIGDVITEFIGIISGVVDILTGFFTVLSGLFTGDGDKVLEGYGKIVEGIKGIFSSIFDYITKGVFGDIVAWFDENVIQPLLEFFGGFVENIGNFFSGLWLHICEIWTTVSTWFSVNVIEPVVAFFQGLWERVSQIFEGLWIIVQEIWILVSTWFNEFVITPVVTLFQGLWEMVSGIFTQLWEGIKVIWGIVSAWFNEFVITPVVGFFQGLWEAVSGFFTQLWEDIKMIWSVVSGWFDENIITPVKNIFETACESIGGFFSKLWQGISEGVVGAMNAVIGSIEKAINWIVGGINGIISGFNKVVSWAAQIAETEFGGVELVKEVHLNRISIGGYAAGGFPETGELFLARENGITEMVGSMGKRAAVANNNQIVDGIADGVYPAVYHAVMDAFSSNGSRKSGDVVVQIDGREVFRSTRKEAQNYFNMNGCSPFPV